MPGMRACYLFSLERGDRDAIVTTGGTRIPKVPGMKSDGKKYPPGTISATSHLTGCLEITNNNARCTKCINVY